ncbi:hypothetical protein EVAR_35273_1 [Eumeta japonica]|uniref:Uncharacterized protein n=1 Tax=Eumeta variegata TaxID=151549 RepID=A0A4C1VEM0_EUMVA|nr:hypothetical protein EVAR_35273_1 [Eumeta japonica]
MLKRGSSPTSVWCRNREQDRDRVREYDIVLLRKNSGNTCFCCKNTGASVVESKEDRGRDRGCMAQLISDPHNTWIPLQLSLGSVVLRRDESDATVSRAVTNKTNYRVTFRSFVRAEGASCYAAHPAPPRAAATHLFGGKSTKTP